MGNNDKQWGVIVFCDQWGMTLPPTVLVLYVDWAGKAYLFKMKLFVHINVYHRSLQCRTPCELVLSLIFQWIISRDESQRRKIRPRQKPSYRKDFNFEV